MFYKIHIIYQDFTEIVVAILYSEKGKRVCDDHTHLEFGGGGVCVCVWVRGVGGVGGGVGGGGGGGGGGWGVGGGGGGAITTENAIKHLPVSSARLGELF